jgi:prostaglandin-endoperoxide synthase 2
MTLKRERVHSGFGARISGFLIGNFQPFWDVLTQHKGLKTWLSNQIINSISSSTRTRPHPYSTVSDYTSWRSLTDRTYFARHLAPLETQVTTPDENEVLKLFRRPEGGATPCPKSTLLFPVFAQYLTDGFLRTNMEQGQRHKTTSNHQIDLSPLYGRTQEQTDALRDRERRGHLKSQKLPEGEFPPYLILSDGRLDPQFACLDATLGLKPDEGTSDRYDPRRKIFAVGGDRANATPFVSALNTLLLREHNRLAAEIARLHPAWDSDRVFETARNTVIVIYIKLVVEDYINHIASACPPLLASPKLAWSAKWNKPIWMTVEFALLYRWHSLVPDQVSVADEEIDAAGLILNNSLTIKRGLAGLFADMSKTKATRLGLHNTPAFLMQTELAAIRQARDLKLPRYNEYRDHFGLPRLTRFSQVTGDPDRRAALEALYDSPDDMDFYVGLFAEDTSANTPMSSLVGTMVAVDAFTQALTNPLLSEHVFNENTFSAYGMSQIETTHSLADLLDRNTPEHSGECGRISMTREDWKHEFVPF